MNTFRKRCALVAVLVAGLSVSACTATSGFDTVDMAGSSGSSLPIAPEMAQDIAEADATAQSEAQVIQQAWLEIEVEDIDTSVGEVTELAADFAGRIDQRSINRGETDERTSAHLVIRVPSDRLTDAIDQLGELGTVRSESTTAQDVTLQHIDLSARVDSLSSAITRLEALLEQTTSVAELIEVETALANRQAELESLTAQLEALTDEVQYATLFVDLRTKASPVVGGDTTFWDALGAGFWSIITAVNGLIIGAGYVLPWLVLGAMLALIIWLVIRARRRRKKTLDL